MALIRGAEMKPNESKTKQILLFGHDAMLLSTRKWLMDEYGNVHLATDVDTLRALAERYSFDLVVVCHTVTAEECQQLLDAMQSRSPEANFLSLMPASHAMSPTLRNASVSNTEKFELVDGDPGVLVHKVCEILRSAQVEYDV